jgi:endonuclease-3
VINALEKLYPHPKLALNFSTPLELLVALILAAQYRDSEVNKRTAALFKKYKTARDWAEAPQEEIERDIQGVFGYRRKAAAIRGACQQIVRDFGGVVPDTVEALVTLKGVGRKTANVLLGNAFGKQTIGVDRHVLRVSQRLGLARRDDPDEVEAELLKIVPANKRTKFCLTLQLHGRTVCTAPVPQCSQCALVPFCPYARSGQSKK